MQSQRGGFEFQLMFTIEHLCSVLNDWVQQFLNAEAIQLSILVKLPAWNSLTPNQPLPKSK